MIKLNKKYAPIIANDHTRYFVISGGRGSSKSFSINTLLCMMMLESRRNILFLRKTLTSAHLSIIPEFLEKLELLGVKDMFHITKTEIVNKTNGATIYFRGMQSSSSDNTANLKSLNGISVLVMDEAEEATQEEVFDRIDLSVRQQGAVNKVIIALNPTTTEHWIYRRFFEDAGVQQGFNGVKGNTTYIHTDYRDNIKHLSESFIQQVENIKNTNPKKYEHTILGGWLAKAEGVVFTNWKIGKFQDNGRNIYGQDYGFSVDPTTLIQVSIDKPLKKIYVKELVYKSGLTTSEIASLNQRYAGESLIIGDSAEPRLIEELKQQGCNIIPAVKGPGSVSVGISLIQDYEVIIDPDSTNLIKEFNNYVWSNKKSSTPIDDYNHCFVGSTMITTSKGLVPMQEIKEGDFVLTSKGFKIVLKKFNNGLKEVNKYTIEVDGVKTTLNGTKEHKIKSDKWRKISELKSGMRVYLHKPSMEKSINCIQEKSIFQEGVKECTVLCGSSQMEKFQKDFTSTTKMKIHGITLLIIWNVLKVKNIFLNTVEKGFKKILNLLKNFNQKVLKKQKNGMHLKKVNYGTQYKGKEHGLIGSIKNIIVSNAEVNLNQDTQALLNTAITTARLKHFEQGESWNEEVYDIMVEDTHEYFANGILVHNCIDPLRYVCTHELSSKAEVFFF